MEILFGLKINDNQTFTIEGTYPDIRIRNIHPIFDKVSAYNDLGWFIERFESKGKVFIVYKTDKKSLTINEMKECKRHLREIILETKLWEGYFDEKFNMNFGVHFVDNIKSDYW